VSLKNMTVALVIALAYEILFKLSHMLAPSLFNLSIVSLVTSLLSFIVWVTIILFMFLFYKEERSSANVAMAIKMLIACIVLQFVFRSPAASGVMSHQTARLVGEVIGLVKAVVLFALVILYRSTIPIGERSIKQAAVFIAVMFGIGIVKSLSSIIYFARFLISGTTVDYPPAFYSIMFIVFLATHASIIYFLYRYYQFKLVAR
jgi:hypothetical protein